MTKEEAMIELKRILHEHNLKTIEIEKEAKRNGVWQMGLDANNQLFRDAQLELWEKMRELHAQIDE